MSFNLERALEDLAEAGASRRTADDDALRSRVAVMTTRIRRRRALRQAGTTVVAACAVGALALGVSYLPGVLRGMPTGPAASPSGTLATDTGGIDFQTVELEALCGTTLDARQLHLLTYSPEPSDPVEDDGGYLEIVGTSTEVNGAAVELEYTLPSSAQLRMLGWTVLVTDDAGTIVGGMETGVVAEDSPSGAERTTATVNMPTTSCADGEPLAGSFNLVGIAESMGSRWDLNFAERVVSIPFPVDLGGEELATDPLSAVFACNAPAPESIHSLPDSGWLTLAADLPEGPWASGELPEIHGVLGAADGRTVLANVGQGVSGAVVDAEGIVVAFVHSDSGDVGLVELGPESTVELQSPQLLTVCNPDGSQQYQQGLEGDYTFWPFVPASLKEVVDSEGNASSPSDTVIVIANPQEVTFTK